jgi:hypothetical protein
MCIKFIGMAIAVSAVMASASAHAASKGISYDCDTAADHFSELVLPAPAGGFVVRGQVKVNAVAASAKYVPLTRLTIAETQDAPGASPKNAVGFELSVLPAKMLGVKTKDKNPFLHFAGWDETRSGTAVSYAPVPLAETQEARPFSLIYDGKTVTMQFADQQHSIAFTTNSADVRLICSTGEFLYTGLTIEPR